MVDEMKCKVERREIETDRERDEECAGGLTRKKKKMLLAASCTQSARSRDRARERGAN